MKKQSEIAEGDEILCPSERAWRALGRWCYRRRKSAFGLECAICNGCPEIFICEGPISFEICEMVERLVSSGLLKYEGQPKGSLWLDKGGSLPDFTEGQWHTLLKVAQDFLYTLDELRCNELQQQP